MSNMEGPMKAARIPGLAEESLSEHREHLLNEVEAIRAQFEADLNATNTYQLLVPVIKEAIQKAKKIFESIQELANADTTEENINTIESLVLELNDYLEEYKGHFSKKPAGPEDLSIDGFLQAGFRDDRNDSGGVSSPIDNPDNSTPPPMPERTHNEEGHIESEVEKDLAFYRAWQNNADPSAVFSGYQWKSEVTKIDDDIALSLLAAGYAPPEVKKLMKPLRGLLKIARSQKEYQTRNLTRIRSEIHSQVSALLAGREPNPKVFRARYVEPRKMASIIGSNDDVLSSTGAEPYPALTYDTQEEDDVSTLPAIRENFESIAELDDLREAVSIAKTEWDKFAATIPPYHLHFEQERVRATLQAIDSIIADPSYDTAKKVAKLNTQLEFFSSLVKQIRSALADTDDAHPTDPAASAAESAKADEGEVSAGDPDDPSTWQLEPLDKTSEEQMGDPNDPTTWRLEPMEPPLPTAAVPNPESDSSTTPPVTSEAPLPSGNETVTATPEPAPAADPATTEKHETNSESEDEQKKEENEKKRKEMGEALREAKQKMRELETQYNDSLRSYYLNRGSVKTLLDGLRQARGKTDGFPPELQELQNNYDQAADSYQKALEEKLTFRFDNQKGVNDASAYEQAIDKRLAIKGQRTVVGTDGVTRLFGVESEADIRASAIAEAQEKSLFNKPLKIIRAHPRAARAIGLGIAAGVGALSGGIPTALASSARWALATFGGGYFAKKVYEGDQGAVDAAELALQQVKDDGIGDLTATERRNALRQSEASIRKSKARQRSKAILAAMAVGASASYGMAAGMSSFSGGATDTFAGVRSGSTSDTWADVESGHSTSIDGTGVAGDEAQIAAEADTYTVKPGDSIWRIATREHEDILKDLSTQERNEVLTELRTRINENPDLQEEVGVTSGEADMIKVGDQLDLDEIKEELQDIINKKPRRGPLSVNDLAPDQQKIRINVRQPVNTPVAEDLAPTDVPKTPDATPSPRIPTTNPLEAPLPVQQDPMYIKPFVLPDTPLPANGNYLTTPEYQALLTDRFGSLDNFSRLVNQNALQFENQTYDIFNRVLQDFKSPFKATPQELLNGRNFELARMPIGDINSWRAEFANSDAMRSFALENGFKYETLAEWMKKLDNLTDKRSGLAFNDKTTLGDLYARSVAKQITLTNK